MSLKDKKDIIDQLVKTIKAGDKEAFGELYDILIDPIHKFVYFKCRPEDVEDLLEVVFLKVWEKIGLYKDDISFTAWVYKIAHNTVIDYYRTHKPIESMEHLETVSSTHREHNPIKQTETNLTAKIIRDAIKSLEEPYQQIISLSFLQDLSHEEVQVITGKSYANVRVLKYRGLKKLKAILSQKNIDMP